MASPDRVRSDSENLYFLVQLLDVLRIGLEAYQNKRFAAWLVISARLHQLLTDTARRKTPVALRVLPELTLHPMKQDLRQRQLEYILASPVSIHYSRPNVNLEIFETSRMRIPINDWLEQIAYIVDSNEITLRELIVNSRDKLGGGHYDPVLDPATQKIEKILTFVHHDDRTLVFADYLVAIAIYVLPQLEARLIGALGNGYRVQGMIEKAAEFFDVALQKLTDQGDLQGQSEQWNNLGYLAYTTGDFGKAKQYYENAQRINLALGWQEAIDNVNYNLQVVDTP